MTFSTRFGFHWAAPLAVAGLLAGCQSSRSAFQFAPAAPYASASPAGAAPAPVEASAPSVATLRPVAPLPVSVRRLARRLASRPVPRPAGQPAEVAAPLVAPAAPAGVVVARPHRHHAALARTQESGLKRIFFFFVVVFLGVLAGLGALVSLIPGVSFFGGVGLAAAGLLVLFLLYSLLSGGKKTAKAK